MSRSDKRVAVFARKRWAIRFKRIGRRGLRFRQRKFSITFVGVGFDRPVIVNSSVCYKAGASPAATYKPISDIVVATLAVAFHTDMSYQAVA